MTYASYLDVQSRAGRDLTDEEIERCNVLLEDASLLIDACNQYADANAKRIVACRMVNRVLTDGDGLSAPLGSTQGSMSGLGYSQSWSIGSGSLGELYVSKFEKTLLRHGNKIGSKSPLEDL